MKKSMCLNLSFYLLLASTSIFARPTCHVDLEIVGLDKKVSHVRITDNPLFTASSSSVTSLPNGVVLEPYDSYEVEGVDFRKYDIEQSFSLMQRAELAEGNVVNNNYFLYQSLFGPDKVYAKIFLLKAGSFQGNGQLVANGASLVINTSERFTKGEIFYMVDCKN